MKGLLSSMNKRMRVSFTHHDSQFPIESVLFGPVAKYVASWWAKMGQICSIQKTTE